MAQLLGELCVHFLPISFTSCPGEVIILTQREAKLAGKAEEYMYACMCACVWVQAHGCVHTRACMYMWASTWMHLCSRSNEIFSLNKH